MEAGAETKTRVKGIPMGYALDRLSFSVDFFHGFLPGEHGNTDRLNHKTEGGLFLFSPSLQYIVL